MTAPGNVLSLAGVGKLYGPKLVFRGVTVDIRGGEAWLLVGANGAGKSTLLGIMAGLSRPSAGRRILYIDQSRVGYLGHQTFLYPRLTARQNLAFWGSMYGLDLKPDSIDEALTRVRLGAVADEQAGRFSRGMAQRLSLARVFLTEPGLLFLDEPGTGLDARSQDMLRQEIAAAKARGAALVWISHHVGADMNLADNVLHLAGGKAAYCGSAAGFTPSGDIC